jgi:hypothetical protein
VLGRLQAVVHGHGTAAVEDDLDRGGRTPAALRHPGGLELEHERELVGGLYCDEVDVEVGVDVHARAPVR